MLVVPLSRRCRRANGSAGSRGVVYLSHVEGAVDKEGTRGQSTNGSRPSLPFQPSAGRDPWADSWGPGACRTYRTSSRACWIANYERMALINRRRQLEMSVSKLLADLQTRPVRVMSASSECVRGSPRTCSLLYEPASSSRCDRGYTSHHQIHRLIAWLAGSVFCLTHPH